MPAKTFSAFTLPLLLLGFIFSDGWLPKPEAPQSRNEAPQSAYAATATATPAQDQEPDNSGFFSFRELITAELLHKHLSVIAGDSLMGRGTGQQGIDMAADYLAYWLEQYEVTPLGDEGGWFQHFDLKAMRTSEIRYALHQVSQTDTLLVWDDSASRFAPSSFFNEFGGEVDLEGQVVFGGLGFNAPEAGIAHLDGIEVRGNWVVLFRELHPDVETEDEALLEALMQQRASDLLFRQGARGLLLIDESDPEAFEAEAMRRSQLIGKPSGIRLPDRGGRTGFALGVKSVSPDMVNLLLGFTDFSEAEALHRELSADLTLNRSFATDLRLSATAVREEAVLPSRNVLGFVEGCHPELKNEVVVLSAHYDHMGIGQPNDTGDMIYNGADDNGSGTVTTLAIAKAAQQAKEAGYCLDRSLLFLFVTAEEHGLLGSRYYSDNPVIPIAQTVANFNLDMFGRIDYEYEDTGKDYIYIIGAEIISSDLNRLLQQANAQTENLILDMRYNDLDDRNQFYRRSDHWNFGRLGVPFIFFFSGLHDDYHEPSDTVDKIPFDLLEKRARLIFSTLVEVANSPVRPVVDNQAFIERTRQ
ncbi:Peptidase family M28 [Cyclonatronum proteinivorum]|uniref:Peptidase family M28 n=1 Tax=Cyclonatronum proteinivorum TaxID=1457365 RepID=A0A345UHN0_9BACT|nr:M28 family peptidase [Cyclonatronum proteinivorum]AXI99981.1 Peptidase family M28 [Cyclonatronum proteinivorum]